ncbi:magnesium transporter CorA family protein [Micromonospora sp. NPDC005324]|uniref:magnesium transporter CorA family protein n=1 Tax=Micromonospora sp. NPDC005324 TaxID=3157033 RepID=UPI0033B1863C
MITKTGLESHRVDDIADLLNRTDGFLWVDMPAGDAGAMQVLSEVFHFHPLAVKDALERNRVPKMHAYADHIFVILHAPEGGDRGHVHYLELDQFIGRNYLVTVHGPVNPAVAAATAARETRAVLARITKGRLQPASPFALSHAIVAALTRNQEDYVEQVTADVWRLEQQVTGGNVGNAESFLNELFRARHGLLAVRTMGALGGAIYGRMATLVGLPDVDKPLVDDSTDQFVRVRRIADGEREYLQGVIEFYQSILTIKATNAAHIQNEKVQRLTEASYAQSEQVKRISAWAAIFFAPSLVAAVYGMNFDHMPELHWRIGYPFALALMVAAGAALHWAFKQRNWL